ncbi:hypothetical protein VULLAG_LOCUS689 [Vulpes lagopus]
MLGFSSVQHHVGPSPRPPTWALTWPLTWGWVLPLGTDCGLPQDSCSCSTHPCLPAQHPLVSHHPLIVPGSLRLHLKRRCGLCIQWNIPQPLETTNTHHLLGRGWNWRVLC